MDCKLIISDEYINECEEYIKRQGDRIDVFLTEYINILREATENAFCSGAVHSGLNQFINRVEPIQGIVSETASLIANGCAQFLSEIDQADKFIY